MQEAQHCAALLNQPRGGAGHCSALARFLDHGALAMQPLVLRQVAEIVTASERGPYIKIDDELAQFVAPSADSHSRAASNLKCNTL
jgi:hypothetical protein